MVSNSIPWMWAGLSDSQTIRAQQHDRFVISESRPCYNRPRIFHLLDLQILPLRTQPLRWEKSKPHRHHVAAATDISHWSQPRSCPHPGARRVSEKTSRWFQPQPTWRWDQPSQLLTHWIHEHHSVVAAFSSYVTEWLVTQQYLKLPTKFLIWLSHLCTIILTGSEGMNSGSCCLEYYE